MSYFNTIITYKDFDKSTGWKNLVSFNLLNTLTHDPGLGAKSDLLIRSYKHATLENRKFKILYLFSWLDECMFPWMFCLHQLVLISFFSLIRLQSGIHYLDYSLKFEKIAPVKCKQYSRKMELQVIWVKLVHLLR